MQLRLSISILAHLYVGACAYEDFLADIPNSDKVRGCNGEVVRGGIGHRDPNGGGRRNPFGEDFDAAGFEWNMELCQKDSDGDGLSNGMELGDPNCVWVKGATPEVLTEISSPSIACVSVASPEQGSGEQGSDEARPAAAATDASDAPSFWTWRRSMILHGVCMLFAWGLILPVGAAAALFWRKTLGAPLWFDIHFWIQLFGTTLGLLGFWAAYHVSSSHFSASRGPHKPMGLGVTVVLVVQVVGGLMRPHKPKAEVEPDVTVRRWWRKFHSKVGMLLLMCAMFQCATGISLWADLSGLHHLPLFWTLLFVFLICVSAATALFGFIRGEELRDREGR